MGLIDKLFGTRRTAEGEALYAAIIAAGRQPHWYLDGAVPDSMDGRFDMIATILALVLLRLEADPATALASARLTERFIADMDGQLRQSGVGDVGIGKHVGQMMSMLGGRIGAYREGLAGGDLGPALLRNLYRGVDPGAAALAHTRQHTHAFHDSLAARPTEMVLAGAIA